MRLFRIARATLIFLVSVGWVHSPAVSTENTTYTYDALGRLTAVTSNGTINNGVQTNILFDPAGNRLSYKVEVPLSANVALLVVPAISAGLASPKVDYLIVAGGGGGGSTIAGGGGAGGVLQATGYSAPGGAAITVTVGSGGAGAATRNVRGTSGGNSVFNGIVAIGGGGGGSYGGGSGGEAGRVGLTGGSGGGAAAYTSAASGGAGTLGQGNRGGNAGATVNAATGGGGGAGAAGGDGNASSGLNGSGGDGIQSSITGTATYYGGGGGGGNYSYPTNTSGGLGGGGGGSTGAGSAGAANTGGGGGGGGFNGADQPGGNGGSGVVIIRYPDSYAAAATTGSPTVIVGGGYWIYKFTTSGTITLPGGGGGGGYDPDAAAYFAAMTVQPDAGRKALINDLIVGLKTDGLWAKIAWLSLLASHDAQAARLNARYPAKTLTAINSPTFTTDRGYAGNGSSSYLSSGETLNASGTASLDSTFIATWANTAGSSSWRLTSGSASSSPLTSTAISHDGSTVYLSNNDYANITVSTSVPGFYVGSRTGSNAKALYKNGSLIGSASTMSIAIPTQPVYVSMQSNLYSDARQAAFAYGAGLTAIEVSNFYSRLNTYLSAIGAN